MHQLVIYIAKYLIIEVGLVVLVVLMRLKGRRQLQLLATIVTGGIIAYLLAKLGSHLFYDPRPFVAGHFTPYFSHANDNGFPSDHTLLAGLLAFAVWPFRHWTAVAILIMALLIGGSRVIAGVHHGLDIIGALIFAGVGAAIGWYVVQRFAAGQPATDGRPPARRTN